MRVGGGRQLSQQGGSRCQTDRDPSGRRVVTDRGRREGTVVERGIDERHEVAPAAEHRQREAAADRLAQGREVRADAVEALCSPLVDGEADDLVEDQHDAVPLGLVPERAEELLGRRHHAVRRVDRLDDDRGEGLVLASDGRDGPVDVVVLEQHRRLDDGGGEAGRHVGGVVVLTVGHGHRVARAVVRAANLRDLRSSGAARAMRLGRGSPPGPRVAEAHPLMDGSRRRSSAATSKPRSGSGEHSVVPRSSWSVIARLTARSP